MAPIIDIDPSQSMEANIEVLSKLFTDTSILGTENEVAIRKSKICIIIRGYKIEMEYFWKLNH